MNLDLSIGGEEFRIAGSRTVLKAIADRYRPFTAVVPNGSARTTPIALEIESNPKGFESSYERAVEANIKQCGPEAIRIDGAVTGDYSIAERRGLVRDVSGIAEVDAFLRCVLSVSLPLGGALLLHGAAISDGFGGAIALCGASGSGKSTAAAALNGFCDELVVLRPTHNKLQLHSTPYWSGQLWDSPCQTIVALARGGRQFVVLRNTAAVRALAGHVVRYVAIESIERTVLDLLCAICTRAKVCLASCPEGKEFIPFLRDNLGIHQMVA